MGVITNIQSALNSKLNTLPSKPPIAWSNTEYKNVQGTTYLRPTLLPAGSQLDTLQRGQRNQGIYQVDIYVPLDKGIATITTWMDAIVSHFDVDSLTANGTIVYIQQISTSSLVRDNSWFTGYISINYICNS